MSDWCPENDGAYRAELAAAHKDSLEAENAHLRAENERLREAVRVAELVVQSAMQQGFLPNTPPRSGLDKTTIDALSKQENNYGS